MGRVEPAEEEVAVNERDLLMIPGPVEFEPEVMKALGRRTRSHVDPEFILQFGRALASFKEICEAPSAQPFIVAGSGTLAMEMAIANLIEPGDHVLVVNTGYFSDRMAHILDRHGAHAVHVRAPLGDAPLLEDVERQLTSGSFKAMTLTHVDTSTGVLLPLEQLLALARRQGVLTVVDGVCATGAETFRMDEWGADVLITASQKALGVPPGLALLLASPHAMRAWRSRESPVASVYMDFAEWLPIMEAYMSGRASYFATPPVNLLAALDVSLAGILNEGMEVRAWRHRRFAAAFRAAWRAMGLRSVPVSEDVMAHTLSALYLPEFLDGSFAARVRDEGVIIAGGLHPELRATTFRVGHMNAVTASDVLATVGAIERALIRSGNVREAGIAVHAAQEILATMRGNLSHSQNGAPLITKNFAQG